MDNVFSEIKKLDVFPQKILKFIFSKEHFPTQILMDLITEYLNKINNTFIYSDISIYINDIDYFINISISQILKFDSKSFMIHFIKLLNVLQKTKKLK